MLKWFLLQLCQVHKVNSLEYEEMPWPKTGATHYHSQLGPIDKGRVIKELVVCISIL